MLVVVVVVNCNRVAYLRGRHPGISNFFFRYSIYQIVLFEYLCVAYTNNSLEVEIYRYLISGGQTGRWNDRQVEVQTYRDLDIQRSRHSGGQTN